MANNNENVFFKPVYSISSALKIQWKLRIVTQNLLEKVVPYLHELEEFQIGITGDLKKKIQKSKDTHTGKTKDMVGLTKELEDVVANLEFLQSQKSSLSLEELNKQYIILTKIVAYIIDTDNTDFSSKHKEDYEIMKRTIFYIENGYSLDDISKTEKSISKKPIEITNDNYDDDDDDNREEKPEYDTDEHKRIIFFWKEQPRGEILKAFNLFRVRANISKV